MCVTLYDVNEEIASMLLLLEARIAQRDQQLANLEFQVRQLHRDVNDLKARIGDNESDIHAIGRRIGSINHPARGRAVVLGRPFP